MPIRLSGTFYTCQVQASHSSSMSALIRDCHLLCWAEAFDIAMCLKASWSVGDCSNVNSLMSVKARHSEAKAADVRRAVSSPLGSPPQPGSELGGPSGKSFRLVRACVRAVCMSSEIRVKKCGPQLSLFPFSPSGLSLFPRGSPAPKLLSNLSWLYRYIFIDMPRA